MPKVSIIVPVWNVEKYLDRCLNSLVNQTLKDIEIIVVNDESPDNSQKIIDKYVKKYPKKVKTLYQKNGGQGSARNNGLKYAMGEYIGYVDSDDYIEKDMYELLYDKAKKDDLDVVFCCLKNVFESSEKIETLFKKAKTDKDNAFFNNVGVCNKIYKREILAGIEFRSKVWYEDLSFTCKVILRSEKFGFIDKGLYNYIQREGSTMNNNNIKRNLEIIDAFDDILSYIEDNEEYREYYDQIEYLAIYHLLIATTVRVIRAKNVKNKKEIIYKLDNYMNEKFSDYSKNKYLYLLDKNKKIIYNLIRIKQYWLIKFIFIIKK